MGAVKGHPDRMMIRCFACGAWFEQRRRRGRGADANKCCSRTCGFAYRKGRPVPKLRKQLKKPKPRLCHDCGKTLNEKAKRFSYCPGCRERRMKEDSIRHYAKSKADGSYQRSVRRKNLKYAEQHMSDIACRVCGIVFHGYMNRLCSDNCRKIAAKDSKHAHKATRRARKKNAFVERISRRKVFQRDGWRCHLCGKLVHKRKKAPHPMSPTIDHIVPLCCGGEHRISNIATAHFICNSKKQGKIVGQLRLAI